MAWGNRSNGQKSLNHKTCTENWILKKWRTQNDSNWQCARTLFDGNLHLMAKCLWCNHTRHQRTTCNLLWLQKNGADCENEVKGVAPYISLCSILYLFSILSHFRAKTFVSNQCSMSSSAFWGYSTFSIQNSSLDRASTREILFILRTYSDCSKLPNDSTCKKKTKSSCVNGETNQSPHYQAIFNKRKSNQKKQNSYFKKAYPNDIRENVHHLLANVNQFRSRVDPKDEMEQELVNEGL